MSFINAMSSILLHAGFTPENLREIPVTKKGHLRFANTLTSHYFSLGNRNFIADRGQWYFMTFSNYSNTTAL